MRQRIFGMVLCSLLSLYAAAQEGFPVPADNAHQLFYLQRTSNTNTIVYELNYKNGKLNESNPIHVFWIRYAEQGQRAELSFIQRAFAYGVKIKQLPDSSYRVRLVSYAGYTMYLIKGADKQFRIYASINKKMVILKSIFVKITGGSMWSPEIEYFEVSGIDPYTNKPVAERKKVLKSEIKEK
ncbi:DUF4833 domain-containing protein [Niastella caeni]|uniref:DUF4833 domain-containing protein n=1 Tax=Niastella caeni TaxID=2569763 RepID=A0A4S8HIC5_9BACT|nr:DUF4833 domain-containing protein [Niastella caeni]THU34960.1 DUF4833 domain-containing protein [Niastella caeni]